MYPLVEESEGELKGGLENVTRVDKERGSGVAAEGRRADGERLNQRRKMEVPKDEDRIARTMDEMEKEARWLSEMFELDKTRSGAS